MKKKIDRYIKIIKLGKVRKGFYVQAFDVLYDKKEGMIARLLVVRKANPLQIEKLWKTGT